MYNIKYNCRYHKDNIFLEFSSLTNEEKEEMRDIMYREDLMNIFYLEENVDFEYLNCILSDIYEKIKNNEDLKECMAKAAAKLLSENVEIGLCVLYSYDFMYLTHECVSEYLNSNSISRDKIKQLKYCLNK
jgi:hypothetical protein